MFIWVCVLHCVVCSAHCMSCTVLRVVFHALCTVHCEFPNMPNCSHKAPVRRLLLPWCGCALPTLALLALTLPFALQPATSLSTQFTRPRLGGGDEKFCESRAAKVCADCEDDSTRRSLWELSMEGLACASRRAVPAIPAAPNAHTVPSVASATVWLNPQSILLNLRPSGNPSTCAACEQNNNRTTTRTTAAKGQRQGRVWRQSRVG